MSKKKFKETKVGKILTGKFFKTAVSVIPGVGPIAANILDEAKGDGKGEIVSEAGSINWKDPKSIIGGIVTIVLLYLAMTGKISWEDAEQAKGFIE